MEVKINHLFIYRKVMKLNLYNKLVNYNKTDIYPMHMPGHKRNNQIISGLDPYSIDITEIDGFDNLFHASGIIKVAMERAASLYGSEHSNFLVGGSSAGILSGVSACTNKGDKVLVSRNCHKSVYNAIYLNELRPVYIYPQIDKGYGIDCGIKPESIEEMLIKHDDIKLIIITSPTYEGVISDIEGISHIAHKYKIPVFVDEAHGAHLGFHDFFPKNSIGLGADIVVHSLHKTLPSFTQTGLLHVNSDLVDYERVKEFLSIYQSTSPSYILMAGIDRCIDLLSKEANKLFENYSKTLKGFFNRMESLKNIKVINKESSDSNFFDFDPSKIVASVRNTNISGTDLYKLLLDRYRIQVEMASKDYIIAMTSICDTELGFSRLASALEEIDKGLKVKKKENKDKDIEFSNLYLNSMHMDTEIVMTSFEAKSSKLERIPFKSSKGRVTGEYIYLYPPGIPILVPGERITKRHIKYLQMCKELGLSIQGPEDYQMQYIKVVV